MQGGGGAADAGADSKPRPKITFARMPVQVFRGRRIHVLVHGTADSSVSVGRGRNSVTQVRFSTTGRWTRWMSVRGRHTILLPRGIGWKGVLVQVRDRAGTRSTPWFQPVLVGPRGTRWMKGTSGRDRIRGSRGSQHIDSSQFDRTRDIISCGAGWDTVYAQPEDFVSRSCERVIRVKVPRF